MQCCVWWKIFSFCYSLNLSQQSPLFKSVGCLTHLSSPNTVTKLSQPLQPVISNSPSYNPQIELPNSMISPLPTPTFMADSCSAQQPSWHPIQTRASVNIFQPKKLFPGLVKYPLDLCPKHYFLLRILPSQNLPLSQVLLNSLNSAMLWMRNSLLLCIMELGLSFIPSLTWILLLSNEFFELKEALIVLLSVTKPSLLHQQHNIWIWWDFQPCGHFKLVTIRTTLSLVVSRNLDIHHLDVTNAFLHGFIDENVYWTT